VQPTANDLEREPKRHGVPGIAAALVARVLSTGAAVRGNLRERGPQVKQQLFTCLRTKQVQREAWTTLQNWAAPLLPLTQQLRGRVSDQLHALRERVTRRHAA
jgi:hypothetical protein